MNTLKESTSYIKGLAEGLDLDLNKKENKLTAKLLEIIDEMAERIDDLESYIDELDSKVDEIDQDLGDLEEFVYDDEDEDLDDDFEDDEDLDDDEPIICPNCGKEITVDIECDGNCGSCGE